MVFDLVPRKIICSNNSSFYTLLAPYVHLFLFFVPFLLRNPSNQPFYRQRAVLRLTPGILTSLSESRHSVCNHATSLHFVLVLSSGAVSTLVCYLKPIHFKNIFMYTQSVRTNSLMQTTISNSQQAMLSTSVMVLPFLSLLLLPEIHEGSYQSTSLPASYLVG